MSGNNGPQARDRKAGYGLDVYRNGQVRFLGHISLYSADDQQASIKERKLVEAHEGKHTLAYTPRSSPPLL